MLIITLRITSIVMILLSILFYKRINKFLFEYKHEIFKMTNEMEDKESARIAELATYCITVFIYALIIFVLLSLLIYFLLSSFNNINSYFYLHYLKLL